MRNALVRWALVTVLAAMSGGQVTELFDHWDHTSQTGQDVDYTVALIATCIGFAVVAARNVASRLRRPPGPEHAPVDCPFSILQPILSVPFGAGVSSPPASPPRLPLRV
jgi:hypothetical protein